MKTAYGDHLTATTEGHVATVVIDRPDPDVEVKIVARRIRPDGPNDIEWLRAVRVQPRRGPVNTAAALAEMKEERGR